MPQPPMTPPDLPLHDIHLPAPVGLWPLAPGWWLLLGVLILAALALLLLVRFRQRRRLRRVALRQLAELEKLPADQLATPLSRLLRQAALSHFPRHETAGLNGQAWLEFLDRPFAERPFSQGVGHILADAPYRPAAPLESAALIALCRRWLKKLPPQPLTFWRGR